jgi:hypothetical protein
LQSLPYLSPYTPLSGQPTLARLTEMGYPVQPWMVGYAGSQGRSTPSPSRDFEVNAAGISLLLAAVACFVATLFVPGDVPAGASWAQIMQARLLSLGLPVLLLAVGLSLNHGVQTQTRNSLLGRSESSLSALIAPVVGIAPLLLLVGIPDAHREWVAPMTVWPTQAILFVLNSLAVGLAYAAAQRLWR